MPREFSRTERVAYQIQRELAALITKDTGDPRLRGLTVSDVRINSDLTEATVYITGTASTKTEEIMATLGRASGFFRKNLARRLRARGVPKLKFVYDHTFDQAAHLLALIDSAVVREE
uniref:Ribosome-binding factor A n=1 Tax=Candidatus Kentrum sp. FM TaxID=2126340 RepID=A0A450U3D8_9GAMM|nr:MAG: ribosome-binding factor A [Candidatus Kentron sp. FM]VFJ77660.1 MAG: ribosome-binding factor A [Candidatus Kentron sp. FM]VFK24867.1 MAG: ribosome-binding factor A [Candidatus Kentron sp. FM]